MTGGGGGLHRGRVTDRPGGAHWWGGRGPAGGGTHARSAGRRRLLAFLGLLALLLAGGVATVVSLTGGGEQAPPATAAPPASPAAAPGAAPAGTHAGAGTDPAALQQTLDDVTAASPVRFAADATEPTAEGAAVVDRLAAALRAGPGPAVTVEGHSARVSDGGGRGVPLSEARATGIARRLEAAGVPADRLRVVGVGPARPLATLEESRRVELRVG
ncbi:MAG TPA: OmpA family protein [Actinomycetospora sp.]|nr:OmpA family protein [Actinomycetospora sp.]